LHAPFQFQNTRITIVKVGICAVVDSFEARRRELRLEAVLEYRKIGDRFPCEKAAGLLGG
jgi:hypothetical protein